MLTECREVIVQMELEHRGGRDWLCIRVAGTGIGIAAEKQEKLAVTHEFVKLHKVSIEVISEPGKGSCFTVCLPVASLWAGEHELPAACEAATVQADKNATIRQLTSLEEEFVQQAAEVVETNQSNADFSVVGLSRALMISRVTLYKKLLTLTGRTPSLFIRHLRLQRAAQLLEQSRLSVSEIAYATGFCSPKYFARHFKTQYNLTPTVYLKAKRKGKKLRPESD